jgi:hypothetical protein
MKKTASVAALVFTLAGIAPAPAQAGGATSAALGLASFAVFNQLVFGLFTPRVWGTTYGGPYYGGYYYGAYLPPAYAPPPYYPPPVYYPQPTVQATYAAPAVQNEVVYPHGRYVLRGDGVTSAYQWVWIANPAWAPSGLPGPAAPEPTR